MKEKKSEKKSIQNVISMSVYLMIVMLETYSFACLIKGGLIFDLIHTPQKITINFVKELRNLISHMLFEEGTKVKIPS